jgi:uncharacterized protein (DUF1800 family)
MEITRIIRMATAGALAAQLTCPVGLSAQQMAPPPASQNPASQSMDNSMSPQPDQRPMLSNSQINSPALPSISATAPTQPPAPNVALPGSTAVMNDDQVILHLLNRFTYGPRPGDVELVRKMGVVPWLRQQLQPETIDDSAMDQRLAAYPAMQLSLADMMRHFPDEQMIRQAINGKGGYVPGGMAEHAIYNDEMEKYRKKKEKKAGKDSDDAKDSVKSLDVDAMLADTPKNRFAFVCSMNLEQFHALRDSLTQQQRIHLFDGFTPVQREAVAAFTGSRQVITAEVIQTKLLRDIYSRRQLQEIMTDFWLNHFNVYMAKSQEAPYYIADYANHVIRPRALGYFEDLLIATAESPAMLNYLDNAESIGPHSHAADQQDDGKKKSAGLNENYAREVMELHTVGVNGGYSQHDVTDLAKVFTGWTIDGRNEKGMRAVFDEDKHEGGAKTVMDIHVKNNGEKEGMQMLHMLATNPHTAHFVCQKLAVRFVSDDPSPALVDRMAATFLKTNGNIRAILASMISSPEFWRASNYHSKVKTPQDYIVSALRASDADVQSAGALDAALTQLGMPLFGHQTPDGYNMKAEAWNSTAALIARLNFAFALAANRINGVQTNWDAMLGPNPASLTPTQKENILEARLLHLPVAPHTRQTIQKAITGNNAQDRAMLQQLVTRYQQRDPLTFASANTDAAPLDPQAALAAGFLIGSPEFQRR